MEAPLHRTTQRIATIYTVLGGLTIFVGAINVLASFGRYSEVARLAKYSSAAEALIPSAKFAIYVWIAITIVGSITWFLIADLLDMARGARYDLWRIAEGKK